jgi:hypothetical protein
MHNKAMHGMCRFRKPREIKRLWLRKNKISGSSVEKRLEAECWRKLFLIYYGFGNIAYMLSFGFLLLRNGEGFMSASVRKGFVSVDSKFRFDAGSFSFLSGLILVLFVGGFVG